MKAVILAGGRGTRLSEETALRPKPMVEIGGQPILWHIMKIYASHGITEFVICCGYKGFMIKEYFANYFLHTSDVTFDLGENQMHVHRQTAEPWKVTLVDTGGDTLTGGRLKRVAEYIDDTFFFTYGDGLSNVDLNALRQTHATNSALVTLTAVQPPGRYGALRMDGELVREFREKPEGDDAWINGGFFCRVARSTGPYCRRSHCLGERSAGNSRHARATRRLSTPRILASHGHLAR